MRWIIITTVAAVPLFSAPLSAQWMPYRDSAEWFPAPELGTKHPRSYRIPTDPQWPVARQVAGGIVAGGLGALGGYLVGRAVTDSSEGGFIGAALVETIALPYGVHWANDRRGDLPLSFLGSYGLTIAGMAVVMAQGTDSSVTATSLIIPAAQLVVSIAIERSTSRDN